MIQDIMEGLNEAIKKKLENIFKMDFYYDEDLDAIGWLRRDKYYLPTNKHLKIGLDQKKKYSEDIVVAYNRTPITLNEELWPNKKAPYDLNLALKKVDGDSIDLRAVSPITFEIAYAFLVMNAKTAELFEILYLEILNGSLRYSLTYEFEGVEEPLTMDYKASLNPIEDINQLSFAENGSVRQISINAEITGFVLSPLSNTQNIIKTITLNTFISNGEIVPDVNDVLIYSKTIGEN